MPQIADSVDLDEVLARLAQVRPVFHSEADFQHAFAWQAHQLDPDLQVRLETHPETGVRLDLLLARRNRAAATAVELKYLTRSWTGTVQGEHFALKNQAAQDIRGYDVVKDIARLERFTAGRLGWNGLFIAVSNDPGYWRPTTHGRPTNADAFRIHNGVTLSGTRTWGPNTGAGTRKNRDLPVDLCGTYHLSWRDYSTLDDQPGGQLRALTLEVTGPHPVAH